MLIPISEAAAALGGSLARNSEDYHCYDGYVLTLPIGKGMTMKVMTFQTKADGESEDEEWVKPAE
jgi:hypothetical protein